MERILDVVREIKFIRGNMVTLLMGNLTKQQNFY